MSGGRKKRPSVSGRKKPKTRKGLLPQKASPVTWIVAALLMLHLPPLLIILANAPYVPWPRLLPMAVLALSVPGLAWVLRRSNFRGDPALVFLVILLMGFGVALQFRFRDFSAGGGLKAWALPLCAVGLLLAALLTARTVRGRVLLRKTWGVSYLAALGVLLTVLLFGNRFRGALFLPGGINPVEAVKPLLCLAMAGFLAGHAESPAKTTISRGHFLLTLGFLWAPFCGMLVLQRDLGMLLLLNLMLVAMLGRSFGRWGWLALGGIAAAALGWIVLPGIPHVMVRIEAWRNPFADPTGKGWQALQALSAQYAGGMWGRGLGAGIPQAVPIFSSDFIYAAVAEEMGFVGCVVLLAVYGLWIARAWETVQHARNAFDGALAAGCTAILGAQTVLNIGGVVKALPMTGVPLPFLSQGGSSLLSMALLAGLLAGVSDPGKRKKRVRKKR